jgi:hypothetical protein
MQWNAAPHEIPEALTMPEKADPPLPPWENDPLSSLFANAAFNERAASINFPEVYSLLKQIHSIYSCVEAAIKSDDRDERLLPRILLMRSFSAFFAAVRLTMSGQVFEAAPVLRVAIEQTWYALHVASDPQPPKRGTIWLKRHSTTSGRTRCKTEFSIANVSKTHEGLDAPSARILKQLYEDTVDFGGHPNERGVLASLQREETGDTTTYRIGVLNPDPLLANVTLKTAVQVAISTLKVSQFIMPERLKVDGLDICIEQIIREAKRTFMGGGQRSVRVRAAVEQARNQ